jgi:hypothetical protein
MSTYTTIVNNNKINYKIEINENYWGNCFNEEYNEWKMTIEDYLNGIEGNDFEYYVYIERGGIDFIDIDLNEELDMTDEEIDWGTLSEQGLNELIEFFKNEKWKK